MLRTRLSLLFIFAFLCLPASFALAQHGGARAGMDFQAGVSDLPLLEREVAEGYIAIDGRAEMRVRPTALRAVLAVIAEAESADACQKLVEATVARVTAAWAKLGVPPEKIHADFIAVLPRYEWRLEKRGEVDVGVEHKAGYRMQTNLHLAVDNEAQAQAALTSAFEQGVTDIIAFDYLSDELDAVKIKARQQAIQAAQAKAELLLALLPDRPRLINLQERTDVRHPQSMYQSFTNAYNEDLAPSYRREIPFVRAYRPQNTYYRGLESGADTQPAELPMRPEIAVVSTVRLYFASPAARPAAKENEKEAKPHDE
jgi:uncharacterized protein YggE